MSSNNQRSEEIVAVLRQALEALQRCEGRSKADEGDRHRAITSLRAAIASYSQAIARAEGTLEAEKQKPVAWWIPKAEQFCLQDPSGERPFAKAWEPLYTHPPVPQGHEPKRELPNLTVDELIDLEQKHRSHESLSRAIEAKRKEKANEH